MNNKNYVNIHVHSDGSNVVTPDVPVNCLQLVKRAKELNMKSLALTDHGTTINKFVFAKHCKKYNIKPIFGMEAYYVKDINALMKQTITIRGKTKEVERKDSKNGHLLMLAKNQKGLEEINLCMSDSYLEGFYSKPRIDKNIIEKYVNPENVILTTACYGGVLNKYGEEILQDFQRFIDYGSFFLEVHPHLNEKQREYNKKIIDIHNRTGIPIVVSNDSHAIDAKYANIRTEFLKTKGIRYEEEDGGWFVDFPSYEELIYRMKKQNVLTDEQINTSIENTILIDNMIGYYDILEYELKVPILKSMQHLSRKERFQELEKLVYENLKQYIEKENIEDHKQYYEGVKYELGEIEKCGMGDYFLFNYELVKLATTKYGGILTKTSRGSASCYIVNFLLGLTAMDKYVFNQLPLFSDRFMTSERILESKTAPDIDYNVASQEPFEKAMKELLGEQNVYPYIALGTYRVKSSWKLFSRMNDIEPETANNVSKAIDDYEKALKYADEFDEIYVEDFIPQQYMKVFNESRDMRSIIDNIKPHTCGFINSPHEVISKIGLITVGKEGEKRVCVCIDGANAESLGYIKSDILVVSVVDIIDKICKKAKIEQPSPTQLIRQCENNEMIWDIYTSGRTFEVNQMTSPRTIKFLKMLNPSNIYDLSTTVAAIRPGAMSVVDRIMNRKPYTYDIEELDDILSEHTGSTPAIIYQESIMKIFNLAGLTTAESATLMKAVSKKKEELINSYEDTIKTGLAERFNVNKDDHAIKELWIQIKDSGRYAFNAPHSLATALDSLYIAWLKVNYFNETYITLLEYYTLGKKRDIKKVTRCKKELLTYGMTVHPIRIGQDNTMFQRVDDGFTQSIMALKSSNEVLGELLLEIDSNMSLIDIYKYIKSKKNIETNRAYCTKRHWKALCQIEYFNTNNKKAEEIIPILYDKVDTKKQFRLQSLESLFKTLNIEPFDISEYCYKKTPKTYYLDQDKIPNLVKTLYDKVQYPEYTIMEKLKNQISVYGFVPDQLYFQEFGIFFGSVSAISKKTNSILISSANEIETWIKVKGDMAKTGNEIKKGNTLAIIKSESIRVKNKIEPYITEYISF